MTARPRPLTTTPAQQRLVDEVLAWGQERPRVPAGTVEALRATLEGAVLDPAAGSTRAAAVSGTFTASVLASEDPDASGPPWEHDRQTVRGVVLKQAFTRDVEGGHLGQPGEVASAAVAALARERPGDPASASHWLNAQGRDVRTSLRDEVAGVLADLRSLWPPLPDEQLAVAIAPRVRVAVADGRIVLTARPDLVLDSQHRDERARALVLLTRAGMPRPVADRALARTQALLVALWSGRLPFRWGVLHLTDGRVEVEDLDVEVLHATARSVGARIRSSTPAADAPATTVAQHDAATEQEEQGGRG